ncbi:concanavalin A-like lectin/glucanase domain-containing protein [Trichophaea hybrida]|nr:concanavalin A-like lectin/glucanase domain-containing protein [Trichophaea hybrida]
MAYTKLQSDYNVHNFFDQFNFFIGQDPTNGFVRYVDGPTAQAQGLIRKDNGRIYIGVDTTNKAPNGRQSLRLESKARYTRGLIVLDLAHMPWGCGTWPAFWTYGDNWPYNGEIDIIEGVHQQRYNSMALHTSDGCSISGSGQMGVSQSPNCFVNALGQVSNQGCQTYDYRGNSWGAGFNNNGGGVYATEWNSDFIKIWFFPRGQVPADVYSAYPEPASWGTPAAVFQGNCNISQRFNAHKLVFNITFCGDWAANVWGSSGCANRAATCNAYVANNPGDFSEAYWMINSLKVWSH